MKRTPVVDAHQHFWNMPTPEEYPWITDDLKLIRRIFGPEDLVPSLAKTGVDYTVLVQTRSSLEETRAFLGLAQSVPFVAGVVGWVDLREPHVDGIIRSLLAGPGGEYLVGIRHQVHDEPDPAWLLREDVLRGLRAVGDADLAFDLLVRSRELPAAQKVARIFPHMRFVVDHIGKPPIGSGHVDEWSEVMAPLSELPNVYCKLSGMVTEADWSKWAEDDLRPYVDRVVGWFGTERLMFGSDWPVCLLAASYSEVLSVARSLLCQLPDDVAQDIFGGNALRFYQLRSENVA